MKYYRIFYILVLSITLSLMAVFPTSPVHAVGEDIALSPNEGEIGDKIDIQGSDFEANSICDIYFSIDKADEDNKIDVEVTTYELLKIVQVNADGDFATDYSFRVPGELTDGKTSEDVHGGDYYVYATYHGTTSIVAAAKFTVIGGEIVIDPEAGQVGTEVEINGKRFGIEQEIIIEYDGDSIAIASGDKETNDKGEFTCTIIIPESTFGDHTITAIDESGNKPEIECSVEPQITIDPTSGAAGRVIKISGTGFEDRSYITITFDGYKISTTSLFLETNGKGSFTGSFVVPSHALSGISKIRASDDSLNSAEAELAVLPGISLDPATSQTSPGYVGMELTIYGTGFLTETPVTITYDKSTVATVTTDEKGNFVTTFIMPPSAAGTHTVTATDGTNTLTSIATMESEAPPIPVPLLPKVADTVEAEAYFDWENVDDPSGITYTLQIGADADFTTIVLEQTGLAQSEYTLKKEEKLQLARTDTTYYWRVKAIDGASNEGKWTNPMLFYAGRSPVEGMPSWILYLWIGLGIALLGIIGFWVFRKIRS